MDNLIVGMVALCALLDAGSLQQEREHGAVQQLCDRIGGSRAAGDSDRSGNRGYRQRNCEV